MTLPFTIECQPRLLVATFPKPQQMLSWSLTHPGLRSATRVAWIEVRNADLSEDVDATRYIEQRISEAKLMDAVALVTSRNVDRHQISQARIDGAVATCVTTLGLSNGERVGQRSLEKVRVPGTINTLVHIAEPLTEAALLETMSIVTQARTAAVMDAKVRRGGVLVTGTGTDCIVVAAPHGSNGAPFAGLHTAIGEAVGNATYRATADGIATWKSDVEILTQAP
ncbi:adenosylcobinamide amidohydrolase [Hyphomicrobium sp.]|uniref:adenosylcobinamide amidohydrolase n=1 Tax=Hyphomicrobium sp. TaxID=82 RepID=UPI002E31ECAE|nr:adenosylcobinamide amidohydrolase [Hyphomicrobium sp.]HEX2842966.1 adenosylcobinamide amidohydrolase [Hyphomicrobium sp.]